MTICYVLTTIQLVIHLPSNILGVGVNLIKSNVERNVARNVVRIAKIAVIGVKIFLRVSLVLFLLSSRLLLSFAFQKKNILRIVPVHVHHAALKKSEECCEYIMVCCKRLFR